MIGGGRFCENFCRRWCCCLFRKELLNEFVLFLSETLVDCCLDVAADNGGGPQSIGELAAENDPPTSGQLHWRQNRMVTDPFLLFQTLVVARTKRRSAKKATTHQTTTRGTG